MRNSYYVIELVDGYRAPWEVPSRDEDFLVSMKTAHSDGSLAYLPHGYPSHEGRLHLAEPVWCCPDVQRRGVWFKWGERGREGRRFIPCAMLGDADAVATALLEADPPLRFNYVRRQLLCNYAAEAYASGLAVTERDLQWPADVLHEFAEAGHGE